MVKRLKGATVDQIREKFKIRVAIAEATKELHDAPYDGRFGYSRYTHCVHVDANVNKSAANRSPQLAKCDRKHFGYVNFVRLDLVNFGDSGPNEIDPEDEQRDDEDKDKNYVEAPVETPFRPARYAYRFSDFIFDAMRKHRRRDSVS